MAGPQLTSPRSDRVVALRRLATRRSRADRGQFLVEGPQAVLEALAAGVVVEILAEQAALQRHPALQSHPALTTAPRVTTVTAEVLAALTDTVHPQGVVAVAAWVPPSLADVLAAAPALVAVLVEIQDPGNLGTVIRTADAAGADAVVLTKGSVDPTNPKVVRATTGSLFHLPVVVDAEPVEAITALRAAGLQTLAADAGGDDLDTAPGLGGRTAWLFGNEARGLPSQVRALVDRTLAIPIHGRAESLNLSVAAALCLYASARARRPGPSGTQVPIHP